MTPSNVYQWSISRRSWLALFGLGVALWLTVTYFGLILEISAVLFGALLFSLGIRPIADRLERVRIPRGVTVLLVYLIFLGIGALMANRLAPVVRSEVDSLRQNGPATIQQINSRIAGTPVAGAFPSLDSNIQTLVDRLDTVFIGAAATAAEISAGFLDLLVVLVLTYFLSVERTSPIQWLVQWAPTEWRAQIRTVWGGIELRLTRWVWAQAGIAAYFAAASTVGLLLLGVPYALTIGLVGGLLEVIPYMGAGVAAILALFSALTVNVWLALGVLLLYMGLSTLESHLIAPILYGRAIGLRSAGVLLALLIGVKAGGVAGVFFAIPVVVVLTAVVQAYQSIVISEGEQA